MVSAAVTLEPHKPYLAPSWVVGLCPYLGFLKSVMQRKSEHLVKGHGTSIMYGVKLEVYGHHHHITHSIGSVRLPLFG